MQNQQIHTHNENKVYRTKVIAANAPLYTTSSCNQDLMCEKVTPYPDFTDWAKGQTKGRGGTLKEEEEVLVASSIKETYVWFLGRNQLSLLGETKDAARKSY